MKNTNLYFHAYRQAGFLLLSLLFLASCNPDSIGLEPLTENLEAGNSTFTQYRGYVDLSIDDGILIGATNDKDIDPLITISWEFGESITFESKVLEFEDDESEIHGTGMCETYGTLSEGLKVDSGTYSLTFQPEPLFWECLSREVCQKADEIFVFDVFVRTAN